MCVCLYVCAIRALAFESLGLESSFLLCTYFFRISKLSSYFKVIRSRSRSQKQETGYMSVTKCTHSRWSAFVWKAILIGYKITVNFLAYLQLSGLVTSDLLISEYISYQFSGGQCARTLVHSSVQRWRTQPARPATRQRWRLTVRSDTVDGNRQRHPIPRSWNVDFAPNLNFLWLSVHAQARDGQTDGQRRATGCNP